MRLLLPIDNSKFSIAAAELVIEQARPSDTEIRVLYVVEPPSFLASDTAPGHYPALDAPWWKQEKDRAQAIVDETADFLRSKGLKATGLIEEGDPKSKILEVAQSWPADLIVIGSHGRKGLQHFLMGSVSDAVSRHADCSVEIVRLRRKA